MMRKKINLLFIITVLLAGFTSCNSDVIYDNNQSFVDNTWSYDDAKEFSFEIKDSATLAKISLNFRNTIDYQYSNIIMYLHMTYPNSYEHTDTLEFFIAQPNGKWLGECSGTVVENQALIAQGRFNDPGIYTYKIEQAMFNNDLEEMLDVGLKVEHWNPNME